MKKQDKIDRQAALDAESVKGKCFYVDANPNDTLYDVMDGVRGRRIAQCGTQADAANIVTALNWKEQQIALMLDCPKTYRRRPYDDRKPDGYEESARDYLEHNRLACLWFLKHAEELVGKTPMSVWGNDQIEL